MEEMKPKLSEYLMSHGVLKNADAEQMAEEIVDMLSVEKLQAQVEGLRADLKDVRQKANHFRNALYMHVESPGRAEAWEKAGQLKAEAQTSQRLLAKMGDTITRLSEAIDPDHKFGPETELVVEHARKIRERNHELEQKELLRSASRPAEAEAMRNVLEESKRLKAQLDSVQTANAELREFALTHFSREQVMPLVEALHVIGHSNHNLECPNCPVCTAVEQALAHARAVGMEKP